MSSKDQDPICFVPLCLDADGKLTVCKGSRPKQAFNVTYISRDIGSNGSVCVTVEFNPVATDGTSSSEAVATAVVAPTGAGNDKAIPHPTVCTLLRRTSTSGGGLPGPDIPPCDNQPYVEEDDEDDEEDLYA